MSKILLFDLHTGGHHLEFASRLQNLISTAESSFDIHFLAPTPEGNYDRYFDPGERSFLFDEAYDIDKSMDERPAETRLELVDETLTFAETEEYDIVHFLQLDDIVREVNQVVSEQTPTVDIVGSIIGAYFMNNSYLNRGVSGLLRSRIGPYVAKVIPSAVNDVRRYRNDLSMYRAMRRQTVDVTTVFSSRAKTYLSEIDANYTFDRVVQVPDPAELIFEGLVGQSQARNQLELDDRFTLLFFGQMRREKGIHVLIESLKKYDGPPFTMLLAGSPTDVEAGELEDLGDYVVPEVRAITEYIPEEEVPLYFEAANGVVTPYLRSFGSRRTSNVFQKAAGALRPIIAPQFGVFSDRVEKWDLGLTYTPDSPKSLAGALETFVQRDGQVADLERVERYAREHSYEALASRISGIYHKFDSVETIDANEVFS